MNKKIIIFGLLAISICPTSCSMGTTKNEKMEYSGNSEVARIEAIREGCLPITKTIVLDLSKEKKIYELLYSGFYVEKDSPYKYRYNEVDTDVSITDNKLIRRITFDTTECNKNVPDNEI